MNPVAQAKLDLLQCYVDAELGRWPQVQGVVVVGSVAQGACRPDSDLDVYVFFHPRVDEAAIPAESLYVFATGEYHDIFVDLESLAEPGGFVHLDARRVKLSVLEGGGVLPEGERAQLAAGILAWDREGHLAPRLASYVHYPEDLRRGRLLSHLGWADYLLADHQVWKWVDRTGLIAAQDQVIAAVEHLAQALFAYNGRWEPYRSLWVEEMLRLPWQPEELPSMLEATLIASAMSEADLCRRVTSARDLYTAITERLVDNGFMPAMDVGSWLFRQTHSGLGYAHNMAEWQEAHAVRKALAQGE